MSQKRYGLLGRGISYSYSPEIHAKIFSENGIDATYSILDLTESAIPDIIRELREGRIHGINVTIPYKQIIMEYLDEIDSLTLKIGAINTVSVKDGRLIGHNTDYNGFLETVKTMGLDCNGKTAVILGTGGSAAACVRVLQELGAKVILISRTPKNIKRIFLKEDVRSYEDLKDIKGYLIVNATPIGGKNSIDESPVSKEIVENFENAIDLIYNPEVTKFLSYSKNGKNGKEMLTKQALATEEIWQERKLGV